MHENRVNSRRNSMVCFKYDKTRHFFVECPKVNNYEGQEEEVQDEGSWTSEEEDAVSREDEEIE
jgi:hypothetical protein